MIKSGGSTRHLGTRGAIVSGIVESIMGLLCSFTCLGALPTSACLSKLLIF